MGPKTVQLETTMGVILIALEEDAAPVTVKNFLRYVEEGFYDGTVFHRVIRGFMIQGGGFDGDMKKRQTHPPIVNEFRLSNVRGTVAMAKLGGDPDSATSQFFVNLSDNSRNLDAQNGGFTVFGKVVGGLDVVDAIAAVSTTTKTATVDGQRLPMRDVPVEPVVITSAKVASGG
ncbi:MAG: peptidylprolyl isomerase [Phycisphaerales bacterium]|nr:MAG: peptidylprolyl isomerase [Phycisphaerales bacterium]